MIKDILKNILLSISILFLFNSCQNSSATGTTTKKQEGELIFYDDFSSEKLDTTKWNVEVTGIHVNNELQAYVDSATTISFVKGNDAAGAQNGALQLKPVYTPDFTTADGQKFNFISGRINTKNKVEITYGSISAE